MKRFPLVFCVVSLALLTSALPSVAQTSDPVGDFLPTYTGPQLAELDIVSVKFEYTATDLIFTSVSSGPISQFPVSGAFYVWGVNKGAGTAGFPAIAPGVLFDSVALIRPGGTSQVGANIIDPSRILVSGNTLVAIVPQTFFPTTGFTLQQYTANLWPRFGGTSTTPAPPGQAAISDFAPNNSNITITAAAPEPSSLALVALTLMGGMFRPAAALRKRKRFAQG